MIPQTLRLPKTGYFPIQENGSKSAQTSLAMSDGQGYNDCMTINN
jgi:hypothetical protein